MTTREPNKPPKKKRGPKPETLKLDGDWEKAVKKAVKADPKKPEPKP